MVCRNKPAIKKQSKEQNQWGTKPWMHLRPNPMKAELTFRHHKDHSGAENGMPLLSASELPAQTDGSFVCRSSMDQAC